MQNFLNTDINKLHHAYLIIGEDKISNEIEKYFEKNGVKVSGNPDFVKLKLDTLKIEDARDIALAQERKNFAGNKKIFIIEAEFITEEAQNSLLKIFEEPTLGTHFFIVSPQEILLPTLKSRMQIILVNRVNNEEKSILKMNLAERLAMAKEIAEAIGDEEATKQDAINLLNKIELELYKKGVEKCAEGLLACEKSRASLYDRGAPVKMILEQLLLSI